MFCFAVLFLTGSVLAQAGSQLTAYEMRWSSDGHWIGVGSSDGIWIFDATGAAEPYHYAEGSYAYVVAFDPVRPYAAFAPGDDEQVQVIDIETGDEVFTADTPIGYEEFGSVFYDLGYSDDGQYLSVLNTTMVYVLDAATSELLGAYANLATETGSAGIGWMTSLEFTDHDTLLVSDWSAHLFVYTPDTRRNSPQIHDLDINNGDGYRLERIENVPGTSRIVAEGWGALYTYDLATREQTSLSDLDGLHVDGFDLSPDGTQLAVGAGTSWYLYDLAQGSQLGKFASDFGDVWSERIYSLAFSPDGERVATLQTDGQLKIWDVATGEVVAQLGAFDGGVSQKWG